MLSHRCHRGFRDSAGAPPRLSPDQELPVDRDAPGPTVRERFEHQHLTQAPPPAYTAFFVTTGEVPRRAATALHFTGDPAILAAGVRVSTSVDVGSITIVYNDSNAKQSARVANAFADSTVTYFRDQAQKQRQDAIKATQTQLTTLGNQVTTLSKQLKSDPNNPLLLSQRSSQASQYGAAYSTHQQLLNAPPAQTNLQILQRATPIPVLSSGFTPPNSRKSRTLLGAILGLFIGVGLILLLERFDTRIKGRNSAARALRVPVLAEIPRLPWKARRALTPVVLSEPASPIAEAYRTLRSALTLLPSKTVPLATDQFNGAEATPSQSFRAPRVLLVTSSRSREGKTTTVANLAAALAETGKRVLVLDCDFRNPNAHKRLGVPEGPGLTDILTTDSPTLEPLMQPTLAEGVRLVRAGTQLEHPGQMATRMAGLVHEARQLADVVLIDSSPILHANDALDLMPHVDSVLIVLRSGRVTSDQADRVSDLLARLRVPIIGSAFIGSRQPRSFTSRFQGGSYGYAPPAEALTAGASIVVTHPEIRDEG